MIVLRILKGLTYRLIWRSPDPYAYFERAKPLPAESLEGAKLYPTREDMLLALPKGGRVAEVGVETGYFSKRIAETCQPDELHLIDLDFSPFRETLPMKATRHTGDSSTILRGFAPEHFDWLYIDGDHSYTGVMKDLDAADRALKPGGFLMCNDYTNWASLEMAPYGVMRAINEFVTVRKYTVVGFGLSVTGNHDLLIRKPA